KVRSEVSGRLLHRELSIDRRAIDADERRASVSFASATPYRRWFGYEILDMSERSIRLTRMKSGAAQLLVNHDPNQVAGVVESVRVDSDRKARATVRFGKSTLAQEVFTDVLDGIRSNVSVGY